MAQRKKQTGRAARAGWNTPDWRDISAYPVDLPLEGWWWEFTRRREDYRHAWQGAPLLGRKADLYRFARDDRGNSFIVVNPRLPWSEGVRGLMNSPHFRDRIIWWRKSEPPDDPVFWVFDPDAPIKPQLKQVERELRKQRRYSARKRVRRAPKMHRNELWPRYLRVLDARDARETFVTIGVELCDKPRDAAAVAGKQLHNRARAAFPLL